MHAEYKDIIVGELDILRRDQNKPRALGEPKLPFQCLLASAEMEFGGLNEVNPTFNIFCHLTSTEWTR